MNQSQSIEYNKQVYYRLVALWVICEAFAGGIMHAANIPFAGMIVSALAIICIVLIAYYYPVAGSIIKATIIVAIFKLMLSPYSPPTAYIAVFFQGFMGQLLLMNKKFFSVAAIILAVLALVESAIQRILVLIIFSGTEFWKAVNQYIQKLTGEKKLTDYSSRLAIGYIIIHAVVGIFVGAYAAKLAKASAVWKGRYPELMVEKEDTASSIISRKSRGRRKLKLISAIILILLAALYIQSLIDAAHAVIPPNIIVNILLRSVIILLVWYLIAGPLLMILLKRSLQSQKAKYKNEMSEVMLLLPQTRYVFRRSFKLSEAKKGLGRVKLFLKILLINILSG